MVVPGGEVDVGTEVEGQEDELIWSPADHESNDDDEKHPLDVLNDLELPSFLLLFAIAFVTYLIWEIMLMMMMTVIVMMMMMKMVDVMVMVIMMIIIVTMIKMMMMVVVVINFCFREICRHIDTKKGVISELVVEIITQNFIFDEIIYICNHLLTYKPNCQYFITLVCEEKQNKNHLNTIVETFNKSTEGNFNIASSFLFEICEHPNDNTCTRNANMTTMGFT